MSDATEPTPTGTLTPVPAPPPRRRGSGCLGRFISALLIVLITTFLSLVAVLLAYVYLLETPGQLADIRATLATAQAKNVDLLSQNSAMQTQVADLSRRVDANREAVGTLEQQNATLDGLRDELKGGASQNATVVAEARASRDAVALFATAEAGRAALLDDLKRRSDRIERFLQRLSDISNDATLDLDSGGPPTALVLPSAAPTPPTGTAMPAAPTDTPTPVAPTDTPTEPVATPARRPAATPRATPTPRASPTTPPSATTTPAPE
jgi:TolA-binding protein